MNIYTMNGADILTLAGIVFLIWGIIKLLKENKEQ